METLLQFDYSLFQLINQDWQNAFFDALLPFWRNKYHWIPLYLFIAAFFVINFGKRGFFLILIIGATAGLADFTSSTIIKKNVERLRPCNQPEIKEDVRLLINCGSGFSFTSSHATNHFALATLLIFTFGRIFKWARIPLFLWAFFVGYAQIYVGVHYPLDVFFGAALGVLIGMVGIFFIRKLQLLPDF